jgi:hypothetical protein
MSKSTLPKDITTQELMNLDYRYHYTDAELKKDWNKLKKTKEFKTGAQFKPGMKLCQHYMPNFWKIQNDKGMSFEDAWKSYTIMDKVRLWGLDGMSNLWLSWIRRAVYMCAGLANSSFYRPHFSRQVCLMTGKENGTVFDPCMGWGGRMLGATSLGWNYIGCDPNSETFGNLQSMVDFLDINHLVEMHNIGAENFSYDIIVDVVITSPPYFNLEVYTDAEDQSYNKHGTYETWRDNWYVPLIENCLSILKDDGISAWNVMKFKNNDMVADLISTHEKHGWKLQTTVGFNSPLANIRQLKNKDVTYIFTKGSV